MTALAPALEASFTERLASQRAADPKAIVGYKQTFRLLQPFASARCGKATSQLSIDDLDAPAEAKNLYWAALDLTGEPSR